MNLAKTYDPNQYEPTIYAMWETANAFAPTGKGEPYSIVMPPPNANGNLHIGHALMADLEDILARYYRMKGRDVAYIPGADHAGFETWVVYERELAKKGQSRLLASSYTARYGTSSKANEAIWSCSFVLLAPAPAGATLSLHLMKR
jgi:valyl-tRNA synthetase